jgi:hypothetical protein
MKGRGASTDLLTLAPGPLHIATSKSVTGVVHPLSSLIALTSAMKRVIAQCTATTSLARGRSSLVW